MSNSNCTVTSVRWNEVCPWLLLVRAARVALMVRVILLALAGVVLTQWGWSLVDRVLIEPGDRPFLERLADAPPAVAPDASLVVESARRVAVYAEAYGGPLLDGWHWATQPLVRLKGADGWRQWLACLLDGGWGIAVWALFGGAIARIAAMYLTYGETPGPVAALASAARKWGSIAGAPIIAFMGIVIVALPLMFAGLLVKLNLFALLLGLIWFAVILGGLVVAVAVIGLALGWPLMWATVAVERSDAFDGISRAYAYVYQRPLHALFYVFVAGVLGLLAQALVTLAVNATLEATAWTVSAGAGEERTARLLAEPTEEIRQARGVMEAGGNSMMRFWSTAFRWLAAAFPMAYLWPAATGVYLLLRRSVDATDVGEITFDDGLPERGLPALATDPATGVPRVVSERPVPTDDADRPKA